ncbi:MAG: ferredoxin family protein [Actinomycetota bacterium]|nr:ferredoxin family protein [Actinomycetota bacterium]
MIFVVTAPCIDVLDRGCIDVCPVDCIYEGDRAVYIHPEECIGCGACEGACPVEAIYREDEVPARWDAFKEDNARFFSTELPGRKGPLGSPGGASRLGRLSVDTSLVASADGLVSSSASREPR